MSRNCSLYPTLAAGLCLTVWASLGAARVPPGSPPGTGAGATPRQQKPEPFSGRITRIDLNRQALVLDDVIDGALGDTALKKAARKDKGDGREMRFTLADKVQVTLDNKAASLKDLKVGQYARVHTGKRLDGTPGLGRDAGDERGDLIRPNRNKDQRVGRTSSAWKIEAFTKAPAVKERPRAK